MSSYIPRRQIIAKLKQKDEKGHLWQERLDKIKQKLNIFKKTISIFLSNLKSYFLKIRLLIKKVFVKVTQTKEVLFLNIKKLFAKFIAVFHYLNQRLLNSSRIIFSFINFWLGKLRFYILLVLILGLIANNVFSHYQLWQKYYQQKTVWNQNLWPSLPSSNFNLAQTFFAAGDENQAHYYFALGKNQYNFYQKIGLGGLFKDSFQSINTILLAPQKRRWQIDKIDQLLTDYPYSWQLLAVKSWYEKELYQQESANRDLDQALWLNPQNDLLIQMNKF